MSGTQPLPFKPDVLPVENIKWGELVDLISKANRYVARYDGLLQSVVNPDVLLTPLRTKEAVLSSRIEGTQATLEEVMEHDAGQPAREEKKGDIYEVVNYRFALITARQEMVDLPLSLRLIKDIHELLMTNVRGENKDPGNFRRIQNWIGPPGSTMQNARFIPPSVVDMHVALDNWEKYLHLDEKDEMVQLAIMHAQFEIIHPFLDGNGRIGRILIPLFLYHKGIIHQPVFFMSDYLESNRKDYYDSLKDITDSRDWTNWIRFFLQGIIKQAEKNIDQARSIINLYENMKVKISTELHSQFTINCLDYIFKEPIFNSGDFYRESDIPKTSASRLLKSLEDIDIIACISRGAGRRPSLFAFRGLLDIIER